MPKSCDIGVYASFTSTSKHFKQPLDTSFGPSYRHLHILTYIFKGKGYYEVGGKKYELEAGDSFIIYPGTLIHYYPDINDKWEYMWVDFLGKEVDELLSQTTLSLENPVLRKKDDNKISEYFANLCDVFEYSHSVSNYAVKKILRKAALYNLIAEYICVYPFAPETNEGLKEQITNYIYRKFSDPTFTVETIENHFLMSHVTLYRYFNENFNTTPKKYINSLRITKAAKMLHDRTALIKNVALSVGFKDPLYFSKVFKKETGYMPSEYLEKHVIPNLPYK